MGLRTPGAPQAPKATQHAPEGTSGADLADFESAFGGMFDGQSNQTDQEPKAQSRFTDPDDEEEDGEGDTQDPPKQTEPPKPTEKDPLEGLEENQRQARERWRLQKELKEVKEQLAELKKSAPTDQDKGNPLKGKTREEIVDIAMAAMEEDGDTPEEAEKKVKAMTPEQIIAKAKEELRKEMQLESAKTEDEKKVQQAINTFKQNINTFVKEKAEAYPVIEALGGADAVYEMIEADFVKKEEEFGTEYATRNMLKMEDAVKKVNETLASEVRKALKSPHMRKFVLGLAKDGGIEDKDSHNQSEDFSQLEDQGSTTLTNSVHRRVTDPKDIRELTNEEALAQSFAYLDT